ncbi:D-glucuronyl C5-epimerase family protein, partial [Actinoplanes sp. NPDC051633]|uniref:D-glucuronyl C5-epimerase family protein n=1 Tax=Actinoplanes sp. NPDC051633 TaxID=3155670 RepID=UPI0034400F98
MKHLEGTSRRTVLGAAVAAGAASFVVPPTVVASTLPFAFAVHRFAVRELPMEISPYYTTEPVPVDDTEVHDAEGVRMFLKDDKLYNHPVAQTQYGLALLESFRITGNKAYLDRARKHAQRLWDTRVVRSDAWFYPYRFPFTMHGLAPEYRTPWYSMMAQGRALSFFIRLYRVTGTENWAAAAHHTFHSFLLPPAVGKPWGVHVVDDHLVLDEYPDPTRIRGDLTYNGHNYSAFGLYDYWVWTRNADALLLLQGAMTTTRDWSARYRRPGWRSRYCLTHGGDARRYHGVHMRQLAQLYAISGDGYFARLADTYYNDHPPGPTPGTVRLAAGRHTGRKFDSTGLVTARKTLRLNGVSSAPSSGRQKVPRQPGIWYGISLRKRRLHIIYHVS